MHSLDGLARLLSLALLASVAPSLAEARSVSAGEPTPAPGYLWLDVDGEPLPFQDHDAIRDALRAAAVVGQQPIERGVGGAVKLVLEVDGTRFHAVFRVIDRTKVVARSVRTRVTYRDSHLFEVAAYELDRILGLDRVPPAVRRTLDGRDGSVQIWMEGTTPEVVLVQEDGLEPPNLGSWRRQKRVMRVFDALVANTDRNQGNVLIDRDWRLWFIDHTRAFGESTRLLYTDKITACDRQLWQALGNLDEAVVRRRLEPFLTSKQISRLLLRRVKLVRHIQKQINRNGVDSVLFDVSP